MADLPTRPSGLLSWAYHAFVYQEVARTFRVDSERVLNLFNLSDDVKTMIFKVGQDRNPAHKEKNIEIAREFIMQELAQGFDAIRTRYSAGSFPQLDSSMINASTPERPKGLLSFLYSLYVFEEVSLAFLAQPQTVMNFFELDEDTQTILNQIREQQFVGISNQQLHDLGQAIEKELDVAYDVIW